MPRKKFFIFPFNGNGIEAIDCVDADQYEFLGFIDDDAQKKSDHYEIFSRDIFQKYNDVFILAVPGSPSSFKKRKEIINSLNVSNDRYITVIHRNASIGKNVKIGCNCLIMAGVVITSNARIHDHVCILPNTVIHHDAIVEEYTLIGSNVVIAGGTTIGKNCYIGSGTNIINGICIGENSLIGLGSNIIKDVSNGAKMVGNPARDINVSVNRSNTV